MVMFHRNIFPNLGGARVVVLVVEDRWRPK